VLTTRCLLAGGGPYYIDTWKRRNPYDRWAEPGHHRRAAQPRRRRAAVGRTAGRPAAHAARFRRYRGDVAVSGPLAENLFYAVSGYYRWDEGPIKTGLDTKGYQIRGNLKYRFPDDSGSITVYGQWIDDQVQFYLPIPLDGTTRNRIPGNDGHTVFSVQTPDVLGISYNTPDGVFHTHIGDGAKTKGGQIAVAFDKKFADGWGLNGRVKYSKYATRFGLWSDGDGVINVPETLQSFLTNRGLGSLANASFTFADGSGAVPRTAVTSPSAPRT